MSNEHEDFDMKQDDNHESAKGDRFDRLMFGPNGRRKNNDVPKESTKGKQTDGVDYNQLMGQLSDIMTSIDKIKPALKELSPLLDYFRKK